MSYAELWHQTEGLVRRLRAAGVNRRDRVAVVLPNGPEMAAAFVAVGAAAACAPLNPRYRREDFDYYLRSVKARALVVEEGDASAAVEAARALGVQVLPIRRREPAGAFEFVGIDAQGDADWPEADEAALVLHTSGTTSRPKLVPLSSLNLTASAAHIAAALELKPDDVCLNIMPLFHIHGLAAALLATLASGGCVVCTDGVYAHRFFEWMREFRPTWYTAAPTMHQGILARAREHQAALREGRVRFLRSCSAPLPRPVMEELEQVFEAPVIEAYGMTEAAHQIASNPLPPGRRKAGSVGTPAGPEVAVMSPDGRLLAPGETGEIVIRGPNVTAGYEGDPEANRASFCQGWFRTGDLGWMDRDGYLYLSGRLKELINRGGEKIAPREIDEALMSHPAVRQAVAFAVPHAQLGEEVGAAVELKPGSAAGEEDLRRWAAGRLTAFKVPRIIRVVDAIPKGPTGKLQRIGLAQKLAIGTLDDSRSEARYVAPRTELEKRIAAIWSELLPGARVGIEDRFEALGGDSLLAARMLTAVSEAEGIFVPYEKFVLEGTVAALASEIERQQRTDPALVPLQSRGARRPLICVPGHDGVLLGLARLAAALGPEQPVWGVRFEALEWKGSIEDLANMCIERVRLRWPHGPYRLAGVCFGGLVALEMARRLKTAGEEVEFLALVDSLNPAWRSEARTAEVAAALLRQLRIKAGFHIAALRGMNAVEAVRYLAARAGAFASNHGEKTAARCGAKSSPRLAARAAMFRYRPAPYDGDVFLLRVPGRRLDAPDLGWRGVLRGRLEISNLAFDPYGALAGDNCAAAAAELRRRLA